MKEKENESPVGLEYGHYVCGPYFIDKYDREYDDDLKERLGNSGIPSKVREIAEKAGFVPFIEVGDTSGMFSITYTVGCSMFFVFDSLEAKDGEITKDGQLFVVNIMRMLFGACMVQPDIKMFEDIMKAVDDRTKRLSDETAVEEKE